MVVQVFLGGLNAAYAAYKDHVFGTWPLFQQPVKTWPSLLPPRPLEELYAAVANGTRQFSNSRSNLRPSYVIVTNMVDAQLRAPSSTLSS
jgi:hypothetical protein